MSVTDDRALETSGNSRAGVRRRLGLFGASQQAERPLMTLGERATAAERRVEEQQIDALFEALSDDEIDAKIAARKHLRQLELAQEVREGEAKVEAREVEAARLRTLDAKAAAEEDRRRNEEYEITRWKLRAGDKAEQLTSKAAQLAETAKLLVTGKRAIIVGIVLLLAWSGVNVQQQLVPSGDVSDPLYWLSYGLDVTLGGMLVLLMLTSATTARAGMDQRREQIKGWRISRYLQEAAILAASLMLNTVSHLRAGELTLAAKSAIPPIMIGMLVWSFNHITNRLSTTLLKLTDDLQTHEQLVSDFAAAQAEIEAQRVRQDELEQKLQNSEAAAQKLAGDAEQLRAEQASRPEVRLDETTLALLPYAARGFEHLAAGSLTASMMPDGGGVPAGGQLAARLNLSKPNANAVRDLMKKLVTGDAKIVIERSDQADVPVMPRLSRAQ